ncbi:MAG: catechol 2,3-dioxygenase-like lactoylglutathione lyase family enzyme [Cellvibrionaceae bacterium]|jgi:catechol 2,3-dioxygenase-like lactoylglutathione lyase family enzyme
MTTNTPSILASNVFYYYADVEKAWTFYRDILGFETVCDYGFAKIMRICATSYITLVNAADGMHSLDEPQSTTIAMVTDEVAEWYSYLIESGVTIERPYTVKDGSGHDGFVALDPEGYFLEFEMFNPHAENEQLLPIVNKIESVYDSSGSRPGKLGVCATVQWLYYNDLSVAQTFYEALLDTPMICDQGWAKLYQISESSFIGLVDGAKGLHKVSEKKRVTVSFLTNHIQEWFEKAKNTAGFKLRTPDITDESGMVHIFVGYDPDQYFLEWDHFLDVPGNTTLKQYLP